MQTPSLAKNSVYSAIRSFLCVAFPLITLKYASVTLGAAGMGKVEFAKSFVSYFLLLAGLGVESLAIREGSALRDDKTALNKFSSSVFSLNIISSLVALGLLVCCMFWVPQVRENLVLIVIFAIQIPLALVGMEWVYYIFENYRYIALRTLCCQIVALILLFLLVKDTQHVGIYAVILVIATYGANIIGYLCSRKYVRIKPRLNKSAFLHFPQAMVLFFNTLATSVYVNSDVTMMGFLSTEREIGIYSVAVKIYTAVKTLVTAVLNVTMPRLSYYYNTNQHDSYYEVIRSVTKVLIMLIPPAMVGVIMQSRNLILFISGESFLSAVPALVILAMAVLFSTIAMLCSATVLMPQKKEKTTLTSTVCGALANIVLNFFMIPLLGGTGAAVTTLLAELVVSGVQMRDSFRTLQAAKIKMGKDLLRAGIGCVGIAAVCMCVRMLNLHYLLDMAVAVVASVLVYFVIQLLLKNEFIMALVQKIRRK